MHHRGKLVIVFMILVGVLMAGYAWWHEFRSNARCRDFWGRAATLAIRRAPQVTCFSIVPTGDAGTTPGDKLVVEGREFQVTRSVDVSRVPGLLHARYALSDDNSYYWEPTENRCDPRWEFGLRFAGDGPSVTVLFDGRCDSIWWLEGRRRLQLVPVRVSAFQKKRSDWLR